jgi:hypothetical protein
MPWVYLGITAVQQRKGHAGRTATKRKNTPKPSPGNEGNHGRFVSHTDNAQRPWSIPRSSMSAAQASLTR